MTERVVAMFALVLFFVGTMPQIALGVDPDTISVTGNAKIEKKPDVAFVTLYSKSDGILMVDAVKNSSDKAESIQKALREGHQAIEKIEVIDVQVGDQKTEIWRSDQKNDPPRPEVIKRIRITLPPDPPLAFQAIDTAIRSGAIMSIPSSTSFPGELNSVVIYGLLDAGGVEDEAQKEALDDAMEKAKKTAALVGKTIGSVVSLGCGSSSFNVQKVYFSGREVDFPAEYIGIDPNRIAVSASANVTFELLDK